MKKSISQRGFLSLAAAVVIVIVGLMGVAAAFMFSSSSRASADHFKALQAFYVAESGLERAVRGLLHPTVSGATGTNERIPCASLSGNGNFTNASVSTLPGVFTVTGSASYPSTPTTLSAGITASEATTIRVGSVANYVSTGGRIMIDREAIDYSATATTSVVCGGGSTACFIGLTRGVDGSTAVAHVSAQRVGQDQCTTSSSGGVPSLTSPLGQRSARQGVQIQEGWTLGVSAGGNSMVGRFDGNAWTSFATTSLANSTINAVKMMSYADGWAVGVNIAGEYIARWDGTSWARLTVGPVPNRNLNGIDCAPDSASDCVAVGNAENGTNFVAGRWTGGAAWSNISPTTLTNNVHMNGVACPAGASCIAVGDVAGAGPGGRPLSATWNGTTWTNVTTSALANNVALFGISCPAVPTVGNGCIAVGAAKGTGPLVGSWNGSAWSSVATGTLANTTLLGVSCPSGVVSSTNRCLAVGAVTGGAPLVATWNGTSWAAVSNTLTSQLNAVKCVSNNDCWAVGAPAGGREIIAHWNGSTFTLSAATTITNLTLKAIDVIAPRTKPWSAWEEIF